MENTPPSSHHLEQLIADHYEATYYDGRTSKPYLAWVWLTPKGIRICKRIGENLVDEVVWDPKGILRDEFGNDKMVVLRYDSQPPTKFEVKGQNFLQALEGTYAGARFLLNPYKFALTKGWPGKLALVGGSVALLWFLFVQALPFLSEQLAHQTPPEVETTVGKNAFAQIEPFLTLDKPQSEKLQVFFDILFPEAKGNVELYIANSEVTNAFAVPGRIVVFRGLLEQIESEEQLAGLLAHEYGHIRHKHSLRMLYNQASVWFIVGALLGDPTAGSNYITANAGNLLSLDYSRGMEREADSYALGALTEKNLSPEGMAQLFEILENSEGGGATIPGFLQTHPGLQERIEKARRASATVSASPPSEALREAFGALKESVTPPVGSEAIPVQSDTLPE